MDRSRRVLRALALVAAVSLPMASCIGAEPSTGGQRCDGEERGSCSAGLECTEALPATIQKLDSVRCVAIDRTAVCAKQACAIQLLDTRNTAMGVCLTDGGCAVDGTPELAGRPCWGADMGRGTDTANPGTPTVCAGCWRPGVLEWNFGTSKGVCHLVRLPDDKKACKELLPDERYRDESVKSTTNPELDCKPVEIVVRKDP